MADPLFVIDWLILVPKQTLKVHDTIVWLAFPVVYLLWTFIHGSGFYPYPFLNGGELNAARVLLNEAGLLAIFLILGLVLVTGGQIFDRVRKTRSVSLPECLIDLVSYGPASGACRRPAKCAILLIVAAALSQRRTKWLLPNG